MHRFWPRPRAVGKGGADDSGALSGVPHPVAQRLQKRPGAGRALWPATSPVCGGSDATPEALRPEGATVPRAADMGTPCLFRNCLPRASPAVVEVLKSFGVLVP